MDQKNIYSIVPLHGNVKVQFITDCAGLFTQVAIARMQQLDLWHQDYMSVY